MEKVWAQKVGPWASQIFAVEAETIFSRTVSHSVKYFRSGQPRDTTSEFGFIMEMLLRSKIKMSL